MYHGIDVHRDQDRRRHVDGQVRGRVAERPKGRRLQGPARRVGGVGRALGRGPDEGQRTGFVAGRDDHCSRTRPPLRGGRVLRPEAEPLRGRYRPRRQVRRRRHTPRHLSIKILEEYF